MEIKRIAQHFIASAAPGQADDSIVDVQCLLASTTPLDAHAVEGATRAFQLRHCTALRIATEQGAPVCVVRSPPPLYYDAEGRADADALANNTAASVQTVVICPEAEVSHGVFLDSQSRRLVHVEHAGHTASPLPESPVSGKAGAAFSSAVEPHRAAAAAALGEYVTRTYNALGVGSIPWERGAGVFVVAPDAAAAPAAHGSAHLVAVLSGCVRNAQNFWAGSWAARYSIQLHPSPTDAAGGGGTAEITSGSVHISTHYYESGNVQMSDEVVVGRRELPPFTDAVSFGAALALCIGGVEAALVETIDSTYHDVSVGLLKEVRRALPM